MHALLRYPPKCKNSPLTPIVTKISFASFSARRGPPTPKLPRSRSRCLLYPEPKFHADRTTLRWDILNRTNKQTNKTKQNKLNITPNATLYGDIKNIMIFSLENIILAWLKLDLVMYYNILHGIVDIDAGSLFDTINCNVIRSRGHPLRIIKQHCNVNCRSSSFVCRNVTWLHSPLASRLYTFHLYY